MKLSDRLEAVLAAVEPTESAADIGTDHGYVPVELVRRGVVTRALAMDVKKGPLTRAEEHIEEAGLSSQITARLSDGLKKLDAEEAEAIIIAGMGAELMIHILEEGRHVWDSVSQWVLSPHSELPKLREWMAKNGFIPVKEDMVFEDGKYYTILDVRQKNGTDRASGAVKDDFIYGRYLIETRDPVFFDYLRDEERKLAALEADLTAQTVQSERAAKRLADISARLAHNREVQHEMQ